MPVVSSVLPKAATFFRELFVFSPRANRAVRTLLLISAALHALEFAVCLIFFAQISTPFFAPPIPTLINSEESFLYAHSIIRQYGFFVIQLSLLAVFAATEPVRYRNLIRVLALTRLLMAGLGFYVFTQGELTLAQIIPACAIDIALAALLLRYAPTEILTHTKEAELASLSEKKFFGIALSPSLQRLSIQIMCLVAGVLWVLWGLGSTVFWEIGVANISSDGTAEMNLLNAMQANHIVRNQQGVMLFGIGLATMLGAYFSLSHLRILEFVMAQQIINALSAMIELLFGSILFPQFLTVFSVQAITFLLFYGLYPKEQARVAIQSDTN